MSPVVYCLAVSTVALSVLSACVNESATPSACLEHRQTDFGNQTYWASCPAHTPDSPWRAPAGNR